jgi:ATP-dependent DNA ligase
MLSKRALPPGFIAPCLPTSAPRPPSGAVWLHDGFRVIAPKAGERVKLYSRPGNDLTWRFPLIVEAVAKLRLRSCIIDGEAVSCGDDGIASFDRIRYRRHDADVFVWAFDRGQRLSMYGRAEVPLCGEHRLHGTRHIRLAAAGQMATSRKLGGDLAERHASGL